MYVCMYVCVCMYVKSFKLSSTNPHRRFYLDIFPTNPDFHLLICRLLGQSQFPKWTGSKSSMLPTGALVFL